MTVADLVASWTRTPPGEPIGPGLAVAKNGTIVPRSRWHLQAVEDGDEIEIAAPFQGG